MERLLNFIIVNFASGIIMRLIVPYYWIAVVSLSHHEIITNGINRYYIRLILYNTNLC